ncbi:MAG: hypothetical protein OEY86_11010 [Nitrospira sp.]|nr:hypothetical protein [Nitrospira sp.]
MKNLFAVIAGITVLLVSGLAIAGAIDLTDKKEIAAASKISASIDRLGEKVMSCIEANNGSREGCVCLSDKQCKFKKEYADAKESFCSALTQYPHWRGKLVNSRLAATGESYSFSAEGLAKQFNDCQ